MAQITDKELLEKHADAVAKFRTFCIEHGYSGEFEEVDFRDLSLGFFIALGITGDGGTGDPFYEAYHLGTICRYVLQYWEGEK